MSHIYHVFYACTVIYFTTVVICVNSVADRHPQTILCYVTFCAWRRSCTSRCVHFNPTKRISVHLEVTNMTVVMVAGYTVIVVRSILIITWLVLIVILCDDLYTGHIP